MGNKIVYTVLPSTKRHIFENFDIYGKICVYIPQKYVSPCTKLIIKIRRFTGGRGAISPHTLILETSRRSESFVPDHFGYETGKAQDDLVSCPCPESKPIANHFSG